MRQARGVVDDGPADIRVEFFEGPPDTRQAILDLLAKGPQTVETAARATRTSTESARRVMNQLVESGKAVAGHTYNDRNRRVTAYKLKHAHRGVDDGGGRRGGRR